MSFKRSIAQHPRWRFGLVDPDGPASTLESIMPPPLGYLISWTTKGSWLHGDERGWVMRGEMGIREGDTERQRQARRRMSGDEVRLDSAQRAIVTKTIEAHCRVRGWTLHAVNARTNHVHVVVTADGYTPETVMNQLKAWCSRRLNEHEGAQRTWWTEHGSTKWINNAAYLSNAINYVEHRQ